MYRAVVTDLDGTLLNNEKEVSEFSKEVINKIREKGVKFFIAQDPNLERLEFAQYVK